MLKLPIALTIRTKLRFFLLLAAAGLLCVIAGIFFVRYLVKPFTGLVVTFPEVRDRGGELAYAPRVSDSPALQAGLKSGDRIAAVGGAPMRSIRDLVRWESGHASFEPVPVTIVDGTGAVRDVVIRPQMSVAQSGWFSVLFFIVILAASSMYLLIHYRNEITNILFAFIALLYMVYTSILPFYYESPVTMFFVNPGEQTVWLVIIFLAFFQKDVVSRRVKLALISACSAVILVFSAVRFYEYGRWLLLGLDGMYRDVEAVRQLQNICDVPGYIVFIFFLVFIYIRSRHRDLKHHIEWIAAGALLALPAHFFFDQLPQILHDVQGNPYYMGNPSNFFLAFLPLSYLIGLVRSRGYRLKILRSRAVIYIAVAFALLAFFAVLFHPTQRLFTDVFKLDPGISGFIVAVSLFIAALYLQLIAFLIIDRRLLREQGLDKPENGRNFDEGDPQTVRLSRQSRMEGELLLSGLMERIETFLDQTRKSCLELQKLVSRGPASPQVLGRGDAIDESGAAHNPGPGDRIFASIRKSILGLEQFNKRFATVCHRQASIRISLALDALVDSVVTQSQRQWNGININYQRRPGVKVFCSPEDIALCLLFVLENAYDALQRKNESILINVSAQSERVTVEIADQGCGVPLKNLAQLGQPFFTTKRHHDGLGLYFTKVLLERNNGAFSVEPGLETGTRVFLHLPSSKHSAARPEGERE
ncbi:MAG: hypothetical protein JXD23_15805 [Spirochaetales bacterium]|nr:hypothetical protein [Spirochaetales bacterium]